MRVIVRPSVEVVAVTSFLGHSKYKIPEDGDNAVKVCAFAAKGCYDSYGPDGRPNVENQSVIVKSGHGSVLEHFYVSLFIEGVTRGLTLELNRHRHFAISQRSTRYTAEGNSAIVLDPYYTELYMKRERGVEKLSFDEFTLLDNHLSLCDEAIKEYELQVDQLITLNPEGLEGTALRKWARGKARNLLPHALETRGTWSANIRAWRHFLETRSSQFAEPEIRRLTQKVYAELNKVIPFYLSDYVPTVVKGFPEYVTEYKKV